MSAPNPNHNEVFEQARNQFLASLSPSEKALFSTCPSAKKLIDNVEKLVKVRKDRLWGKRVIASVSALGDSLKPFFDTISIFVQSHPEYAAIVWGAFHLVFKLANNYTSFVSKLTQTLDRISQTLPHYDQIALLCTNGLSSRLQTSLCKVYEDLLRFCQSVLKVFTKEDGKAKSSARVATGMFWKPFDVRFEELLDDFRFHANLVKSELLLAQLLETKEGKASIASQIHELKEGLLREERARQARDAMRANPQEASNLERELKELTKQKIYEIQRWINPPQFAQELEKAQDQKEPGTAEWLFLENDLQSWLRFQDSVSATGKEKKFGKRAIWLQGNPGCGKTTLAASAIEELKSSGTHSQVLYFFFRAGIPNLQDHIAPLRSFVAQLFHANNSDRDIIDRFTFIMDEQSSGQLDATRNELLELLQLCIDHAREVFFVIDGIDECHDTDAISKDLLTLSNDSHVKLLLLSRPNVGALFRTVPEEQRINIGGKNHADIELYVAAKLDELTDEELLPSTSDITELGNRLILGANGMFLWIRLMVDFLNSSALTRRQRVETIMNVTAPEGIDNMYNRIAGRINSNNAAEKALARRIFTWLLYSKRPLTMRELQVAVSQESALQAFDENEFADFKRAVIMSCAGLVEVQKTFSPTFLFEIKSFQFIHLSVREYLCSQQLKTKSTSVLTGGPNDLVTTEHVDGLVEIATRCILVLSYSLPAQPLSGSPERDMTPLQVHETFPLTGYATCNWIEHLEDTAPPTGQASEGFPALLKTLSNFLSSKRVLMAYIEASYVFQIIPLVDTLGDWSRALKSERASIQIDDRMLQQVIEDSAELARYLTALHKDWGTQLLQFPKGVWGEASAFTMSRLVDQTGHTQVRTFIKDGPGIESISSRYLSKMSELSEDGKTVAILSIWPSKTFEQTAQSSMRPVESMMHMLCTDWVARYELWTVADEPFCIADGSISLDSNEVHLQVQRSLWQEDPAYAAGHWKMQFPMAISPDTRLICVIRTVYLFTVTSDNEARMHAVMLPLHIVPHLSTVWPQPLTQGSPPVIHTSQDDQPTPSTGVKQTLMSLLKPGIGHKRSKSLTRERPQPLDMRKAGLTNSRIWSRSHSRARTPDGRSTFNHNTQYRHWVSFAHHGSHLLFIDHLLEDCNNRESAPSSIVLFKLEAKENLKINVVASARKHLSLSGQLPLPNVLFHPRASLLAFFFPRAESRSCVTMWQFSKEINRVIDVYQTSGGLSRTDTIEDVHFSRDGDHLVVQTSGSNAPEVIPIDHYLISELKDPKKQGQIHGAIAPSKAVTIAPAMGPMIHLPGNAKSNIFKPDTSITDSGNATGLQVVHTSREITIRKWSSAGESSTQETKEEVLRLTRLPAWSTLASSSAAISVPRPGDEKIRIVLNKSARQWEDMVQEADVQLPALVSRNINSLEYEDNDGRAKRIGGPA